MFEAAVDRLGGSVGGAGPVEVGQHVGGALLQGPAERDAARSSAAGTPALTDVDHACHQLAAAGAVGFAVGGDHPLVDAPGGLDLDVLLDGEQALQSVLLLVGEQAGAGVQGPPRGVERVACAAAVAVQVLLDPAAAPVQGVAGQPDDVEGVHHRDRVGQLLGGGGLEPGEPVHRDDLHARRATPAARSASHVLNACLGAALDHVQQPGRPGPVTDRGQVDDDGDVLVAAPGVPPDVLIHADRR